MVAVAASLWASPALAGCEENGYFAFPAPGSVVPTNVKLLLEGTGPAAAKVEKLIGSSEVVLKGGDDVIPVRVERGWVSTMKRVAVWLSPARPLQPNVSYALVADVGEYVVLNPNAARALKWVSGPAPDTQAPSYRIKPAVAEGSHVKTKNGEAKYLKLRTSLVEDGPAFFVVTLRRARGSTLKQVYPVPIVGGEALVGHDGCSGGFSFDDGRAYKLSFELYDSAGNKAAQKLPEIEAQAPLPGG